MWVSPASWITSLASQSRYSVDVPGNGRHAPRPGSSPASKSLNLTSLSWISSCVIADAAFAAPPGLNPASAAVRTSVLRRFIVFTSSPDDRENDAESDRYGG
jgi:hypothetical protein